MKSSSLRIILLLVVGSLSASAQADSLVSKATYFNSVYSGALLAKKGDGTSLSVSTIHGIRKNRLASGVGVGYDAYPDWRTLPVFASVGYDLSKPGKNDLFIQIMAGYAKAWVPETENSEYIYESKGGRIIHPLIGYRIRSGQFSLYFTAGYQWQRILYEEKIRGWDNPTSKVSIQREIQRISLQIGFGLH
ncbi:MAG: hypothetical protein ABIR06_16280 [Cyclobacteriaceae bacterium]